MAEDATSAQQPVDKKERAATPEEFVTTWPLYTPFECEDFSPPRRISFHCEGRCGKETTWMLSADPQYTSVTNLNEGFNSVSYICSLCSNQYLLVFYRRLQRAMRSTIKARLGMPATLVSPAKFQKIGQYPPLSTKVPKALAKNLGEGLTDLYRKALISRNSGYGLAAVTYLRRVVEDKTDELIEVVAQLAESHSVAPEVVARIRAAKNERTNYEDKLKIAATVLPESLVIDGVNPLGELYKLVSKGVHDLSEEECIAVADETKSVFEFTFTHLRAETTARQDFVTKIKKLAGGKGTAQG